MDHKHKHSLASKVVEMEVRIKDRIEIVSGFAAPEVQARKLELECRFFDERKTGLLDYHGFFALLSKMNFTGCQKTIEALFNKYDKDANGVINYQQFAQIVCNPSPEDAIGSSLVNVLEKVKAKVVARGGVDAFYGLRLAFEQVVGQNSNYSQTKYEEKDDFMPSNSMTMPLFESGLLCYNIHIQSKYVRSIFSSLDKDRCGTITIDDVIQALKDASVAMSFERKECVRDVYSCLLLGGKDAIDQGGMSAARQTHGVRVRGDEHLPTEYVLRYMDASFHPTVAAHLISEEECINHFVKDTSRLTEYSGEQISWARFLLYYKGISAAITNDLEFELLVRNTWARVPVFSMEQKRSGAPVHQCFSPLKRLPSDNSFTALNAQVTSFVGTGGDGAIRQLKSNEYLPMNGTGTHTNTQSLAGWQSAQRQQAPQGMSGHKMKPGERPHRNGAAFRQKDVFGNAERSSKPRQTTGAYAAYPEHVAVSDAGKGVTCRRLIVVHSDGSEEVVDYVEQIAAPSSPIGASASIRSPYETRRVATGGDVTDPTGNRGKLDYQTMISKLNQEGVYDIVSIKM